MVGALGALVSVLIVDGLHYLNYTAAKFNHDVVQLPFWALAGFAWHRALRQRQLADWLLLGLAVGMSLWAKYFVVVLVAPMLVFALLDRDARKVLGTPGPWIAAAVALIVTAPHVIWLIKTDFLPLAYAEHRAVLSRGWYDHLWHPFRFAVSQAFFLLPSLPDRGAAVHPAARGGRADGPGQGRRLRLSHRHLARLRADRDRAGDVGGERTRHGGDVGLSALAVPRPVAGADGPARARRQPARRASSSPGRSCSPVWRSPSTSITTCCRASITATARCSSPAAASAATSARAIRAATGKPLVYVIGTMWDGGNVEHYAPSHPRNLVDGEPQRAPWINLKRSAREGRGGGVDRQRSPHSCPRSSPTSPPAPWCSRPSPCPTGAGRARSQSAGPSSSRAEAQAASRSCSAMARPPSRPASPMASSTLSTSTRAVTCDMVGRVPSVP